MARCKGKEVELVCLILSCWEFIHLLIYFSFVVGCKCCGSLFGSVSVLCCFVKIYLRILWRAHSAALLMELFSFRQVKRKPNLNVMKISHVTLSVPEKPLQF